MGQPISVGLQDFGTSSEVLLTKVSTFTEYPCLPAIAFNEVLLALWQERVTYSVCSKYFPPNRLQEHLKPQANFKRFFRQNNTKRLRQ